MANANIPRTIRVFLSSTFRDFAEERDLLAHKVFPELWRKCRERQVELVDENLRWGITEKKPSSARYCPSAWRRSTAPGDNQNVSNECKKRRL